jgi:hypothetical protein
VPSAGAVVVVGIEATGHLHQTLAAHLSDVEKVVVWLVNPAAVTAVRKAQLNRRRKTDWLDATAICELLRRGEGSPSHLDQSAGIDPAGAVVRTQGPGRRA